MCYSTSDHLHPPGQTRLMSALWCIQEYSPLCPDHLVTPSETVTLKYIYTYVLLHSALFICTFLLDQTCLCSCSLVCAQEYLSPFLLRKSQICAVCAHWFTSLPLYDLLIPPSLTIMHLHSLVHPCALLHFGPTSSILLQK